ncbi:MAG: hypothetical protein HY293_05210 [Planctomycetes bacterium]|nr:hypothetical protein [Planctomycetota bacterium]
MKRSWVLLLAAGLGCARPQHPNPYVPPETQYSTGSTLMAAGGLMTAAVGASFAQDPNASKSARAAGTAAMGAGVAMMAASLLDAIEVEKEREKFIQLTRAFYHHYFGSPPLAEEKGSVELPRIPEVPFNFKEPSEDEDP